MTTASARMQDLLGPLMPSHPLAQLGGLALVLVAAQAAQEVRGRPTGEGDDGRWHVMAWNRLVDRLVG